MKAKIILGFLLVSLSGLLMAQPADLAAKKMKMDGKVAQLRARKGVANGLNLTVAQKESFKLSMLAIQKQLQPLRNELGEAEAHQKSLVMAEKTDMSAINKNIEKIGAIRIEMAKIQTKHRLEMRAQLTDEQRLKFDLFKAKMKFGQGRPGKRLTGGMQGGM